MPALTRKAMVICSIVALTSMMSGCSFQDELKRERDTAQAAKMTAEQERHPTETAQMAVTEPPSSPSSSSSDLSANTSQRCKELSKMIAETNILRTILYSEFHKLGCSPPICKELTEKYDGISASRSIVAGNDYVACRPDEACEPYIECARRKGLDRHVDCGNFKVIYVDVNSCY